MQHTKFISLWAALMQIYLKYNFHKTMIGWRNQAHMAAYLYEYNTFTW